MGNLMTTAGGIALASSGTYDLKLICATLIGLSFVIASSCVFNNCIDRKADREMARTQNRPLATGAISVKHALIFASALAVLGTYLLATFANLLAVSVALLGFVFYVIFYSFSKYHSIHGTLIGSIAGAVPPIVGYTAVCNRLDLGAVIFFAMMVLWQMPHFYAIAIYRIKDYTRASIPLLPIVKGVHATKVQILVYAIAFLAASLMLPVFQYTGKVYTVATGGLGAVWVWMAVQGFNSANDQVWARKMFLFSLVVITAVSAAMFV
jgi:protoheme IX farnesyltransferase